MNGIDTNQRVTGHVHELKAAGITHVGRYLPHSTKLDPLTLEEVKAISSVEGMEIFSIWESGKPTSGAYFSFQRGTIDAHNALAALEMVEQPVGGSVYFTVDVDIDISRDSPVDDYIRQIRWVFRAHAPQRVPDLGIYGNGLVCRYCLEVGLVHRAYLAQPTDWAGAAFSGWSIKQGETKTLFGMNVDVCEVKPDAGCWHL